MVKTYDPKKVICVFGAIPLTGYSEGTFISIETQGDGISAVVGCDQEVVRTISPDNILKTIKVTLMQTSNSNDVLSSMYDADNVNGKGILPLIIKDLTGKMLMISDQAWITKKPSVQRGKTASDGNCEWVFQAVVPDEAFFVGGN